jgi:fermentation-respiration switch protein FrsA (DUF1100 family)
VNILTFSFRGYGESEGEPSELGLKEDGVEIMNYVNVHKDELVGEGGHLFLYGRALGGCVATYVATHPSTPANLFSGLVLENTFTSISDLVDFIFPLFIQLAKPYILSIEWQTLSLASYIRIPVLYIHRDEDESVP